MSATKFARPVRNRSSSLRRTDSPNTFVVWAMISPLPGTHHFARCRARVDDTLVPGAPADIPRDRGTDPILRGCVFFPDELQPREHAPGSVQHRLHAVDG